MDADTPRINVMVGSDLFIDFSSDAVCLAYFDHSHSGQVFPTQKPNISLQPKTCHRLSTCQSNSQEHLGGIFCSGRSNNVVFARSRTSIYTYRCNANEFSREI